MEVFQSLREIRQRIDLQTVRYTCRAPQYSERKLPDSYRVAIGVPVALTPVARAVIPST